MWDLDTNFEISCLDQIKDFNSIESFTRTGFRIFYFDEEKYMKDYIPIY
jgi:hypothetical protein